MDDYVIRSKSINLKSQITVFLLSMILGFLTLIIDILLDFIIVSETGFQQYLSAEISSNQFITRRLWAFMFPVLGLIIHYLIATKQIGISKERTKMMDLLSNSQEIIVFYCKNRINLANNTFFNILGYTYEGLQKHNLDSIFPDLDLAEQHNGGEFTWIHKDGSELIFDVVITSVSYTEDKLIIARDVTRQKSLLREHASLKEQIDREDRMRLVGQLAGGIAHDFNNLLSVILGNAELLKTFYSNNGSEVEMVDKIIKTGSRATELTEHLLTISKDKVIEFRKVNTHSLLYEVIDMVNTILPEDITIKTDFSAVQVTCLADDSHLFNAFLNVLVNARDAIPDGGLIEVRTENTIVTESDVVQLDNQISSGEYLSIEIIDTGSGMNKDTMDQIFDPFFTTKKQGTGLGLSRVYSIIRSHQGWISVNSKIDVGTEFTILFPLHVSPQNKRTRDGSEESNNSCLIIHENIEYRELIQNYLKKEDCIVSMSGDPIGSLEYYRENHKHIGLVFLDVEMSTINIWELLEKMRSINPQFSNIILLFRSQEISQEKLHKFETQIVDILYTPFEREDLMTVISSH